MSRTFKVNVYNNHSYVEEWGDPDYYFYCSAEVLCKIIKALDTNIIHKESDLIKLLPVLNDANIGELFKAGCKNKHIDFYAEPIYSNPEKYFIEIAHYE